MKIAIVTNDGNTISQHFGRSQYYKIITVENDKILSDELRQRGTGHFAQGQNQHYTSDSPHLNQQGKHGYGQDVVNKHASMANEIRDCDVLIAGGMGQGAYESFQKEGLIVILTDHKYIDETVQSYINNNLKNLANSRTD